MNSKNILVLTIFLGLSWVILSMANSQNPPAGDRKSQWDEVEKAINQGLPKTAIEKLQPIYDQALQQQAYAEAIKAVSQIVLLESNIQGNKPEEKIKRMRGEIDKAPVQMKPVMEAILANWYWQYFQQNQWRFLQRTQTEDVPGDDFTTWSLPQILAAIDQQFDRAFENTNELQTASVKQFATLLEQADVNANLRPTMFDVIAHNALEFYTAGEQVGNRRQDAFEIAADSPVFAQRDEFIAWRPTTSDKDARLLRAIQLYQQLLVFHASDEEPSALLDGDLLRLEFAHFNATGSEKDARYKAALERFEQANLAQPASSLASHAIAVQVHSEGDWVEARKIAMSGMNRFPSSPGGNRCYNLIQQIESPSLSAKTERVWLNRDSTIDLQYRNLTKVYFRLVRFNFLDQLSADRWSPEQLDNDERIALLKKASVRSWTADLPKTEDFQMRLQQVPSLDDLPRGSYFLIASGSSDFNQSNNVVSFCEVWVSKLAIVIRSNNADGQIDGFILNANTGEPITNAKVEAWQINDRRKMVPLKAVATNNNGLFAFPKAQRTQVVLKASINGDSLSSVNYLNVWPSDQRAQVYTQTRFFTDRSIYRPGQTIQFKGICFQVDADKDDYKTMGGQPVEILFADVNGKEIERLKLQTNANGSFNGSVTAPKDRLMGAMTLRVIGGPDGQTSVSVEEYKRPKFKVELDPPSEAIQLNTSVTVQSRATAYTGVPISDAKVTWRVVREVEYPIWWFWRCWWMPPNQGGSEEIANGTLVTDQDGLASIKFEAKPDNSVDKSSEPTFVYRIYSDVTDTTGETRSSQRTVRVGYTALSAKMTSESWLVADKAVPIKITTSTLNGEPAAATGKVKVYSLKAPQKVNRANLDGYNPRIYSANNLSNKPDMKNPPAPDLSDPNSWQLDAVVFESDFTTDATGSTTIEHLLASGLYRATLETTDAFGNQVTALLPLRVLDLKLTKLPMKIPFLLETQSASLEPGQSLSAVWGSGYDTARAYVEVEHRGKLLQAFWTKANETQATFAQKIDESMRGGFTVRVTMVRENRAYLESKHIDVPWSNKELKVRWERFTSKLEPGQKEKWTATITGPDAERAAAEMVATLYDASLDAFRGHDWMSGFNVFRKDYSRVNSQFENTVKDLQNIYYGWSTNNRDGSIAYPHLMSQLTMNYFGYQAMQKSRGLRRGEASGGFGGELMFDAVPAPMAAFSADVSDGENAVFFAEASSAKADKSAAPSEKNVAATADLANVTARKNLNETAFFFPQLIAKQDGSVAIEFTMPEALTQWKFIGFAHDPKLRAGLITDSIVTSKDLMVQPNPPRFLREGDAIEFTVKVSNQSPTRQAGTVRLTLADARTNNSVDQALGNDKTDQAFDLAAGQSKSFSWRLSVPDSIGYLTYKAVGSSGRLSDGEEGFLPVLSRRVLVTESLPLPIRGKQTKQFDFTKLAASANSDTLRHESLTVQMVSNPAWYAVMALPYLMEYPYECNEQTFSRLYANSLAQHIAQSDPKIERIFAQWRATPALDSPLMKNEDLKSVMLEETPWQRQADSESQSRRNVGILFDQNRLITEIDRAMNKLSEGQLDDGSWSWFPGGQGNDYITLYITTGFGRMRHLGVNVDTSPAVKSLSRLDAWMDKMYKDIPANRRNENNLSSLIALYLYGRSFFLEDQKVAAEYEISLKYWLDQSEKYWLGLANRQSQAHLSIALKRFGKLPVAKSIMASIKERSVSDEELGMFWRDTELSWWWYRAPIETQAMMIEAFDEVMNDVVAVEDCKVWLLKQKQTQDWKTTKATADAVYALLLRGSDLLASDELVQVTLGGKPIDPTNVEAGTGFYQQRFTGDRVEAEQSKVVVTKVDDGVAWGSLHWQYLEDIAKITPHEGTPLKLTKELYLKVNTVDGPTLKRVEGPVSVGDELVVRVVLRTDRDMEYCHLKDHRGSGTEPVNVISRYKYQDGLAYYESTRDTASHFFIDYLPKGTYVFEYSSRVQLRGNYQTGMANIECMYAPEFNSHSESLPLEVE